MALNSDVAAAVGAAVKANGQDDALATRILAWFAAVADGSERLDDREAVRRHLVLLFDAVEIDVEEADEQADS